MMATQILLIAFSVYFIHACFWYGMVFGGIALWLEERLPEVITKPLFGCVICMTPWWGTGLYYLAAATKVSGFANWHTADVIAVVGCAAGLNAVLLQINRIANTLNDMYEDQAEPENNQDI